MLSRRNEWLMERRSWTAICRGAVIHGMTVEKMESRFAVEVRSRIARASYGILCQEKWDDEKHLPEDKIWDEDQQSWKSKNIVKWLVREVIPSSESITSKHRANPHPGPRRDGGPEVPAQFLQDIRHT